MKYAESHAPMLAELAPGGDGEFYLVTFHAA